MSSHKCQLRQQCRLLQVRASGIEMSRSFWLCEFGVPSDANKCSAGWTAVPFSLAWRPHSTSTQLECPVSIPTHAYVPKE
eukprot:4151538-Amphidinium_carterae.2